MLTPLQLRTTTPQTTLTMRSTRTMSMTGWRITTVQVTPLTLRSLTSVMRMMSLTMVTKMAMRECRIPLVWDSGRRTTVCHAGAFNCGFHRKIHLSMDRRQRQATLKDLSVLCDTRARRFAPRMHPFAPTPMTRCHHSNHTSHRQHVSVFIYFKRKISDS